MSEELTEDELLAQALARSRQVGIGDQALVAFHPGHMGVGEYRHPVGRERRHRLAHHGPAHRKLGTQLGFRRQAFAWRQRPTADALFQRRSDGIG